MKDSLNVEYKLKEINYVFTLLQVKIHYDC